MKYLFIILLSVVCQPCLAQDIESPKQNSNNPITYLNILIGAGGNKEVSGLTLGLEGNYQLNKDLLTFRMLLISEKKENPNIFDALLIFPLFFGGDSLNEYALLYGKRFIFDGSALSVSAGISQNIIKYSEEINNNRVFYRDNYTAIPFEVNYHFFKTRKKRFRVLYGLIPIGKPTGFGRSFGFKLFGSFGKHNYVGFGITTGLGWHKKYN
ncbi:hypothetical protein [Lacinutrix chionoecetis]